MKRNRSPIAAVALTGALAFTITPTVAAEENSEESAATEIKLEEAFAPEHMDKNSDEPAAAGLLSLPPVLAVNGVTYYLNADGSTYVTDVERIEATPSEEETTASRELLAHNGAEVARQALETLRSSGQSVDYAATAAPAAGAVSAEPAVGAESAEPAGAAAPATTADAATATMAEPRGIAAETGSNTVLKALVALAIASVIGAAAFVYGRRFLV